jgi:hypothetical protein
VKSAPGNGWIAVLCIVLAVALMSFLFGESRNDPSLRIAALVAGTGLVAGLSAIASTILTGKDVTKPDPADLPPGSVATSATQNTVQVPPIDPKI